MQLLDNRYRDYVGFPPLLRSGENDGKSFSDFYRASQIELFSALDNVLSQKAEDTLTEFAAVKKADVQLQTQLGNRQGQVAANIIGAFAESQNSAFGWQVRVFGAENDTKGANAGIFFRRVDGESLYGINTFADYEKGNYGEFLRYGIGGELQNRYASFAMNYYLPITNDKHNGAQVAFSQKGYDANLRINIPRLDFLKVRADYYHYDGEYGLEEDNGFRYGMELQPLAGLQLGIFYDDGGEKFGGDIVYVYNIAAPAKRESKAGFAPDLFAPIAREYSQRIITATTGPQIEVLRIPTLTTFMVSVISAITTTITMTTPHLIEVITMAGNSRVASVQLTIGHPDYIATTFARLLITLPPASTPRPYLITTDSHLGNTFGFGVDIGIVITTFLAVVYPVGSTIQAQGAANAFVLTVIEGSEQFVAALMTMTTTTDGMTTETPTIILARTITTAMTAFLITTMTIGAAIDNPHLPPSFPPFPQVPKLALAAIPRPPIVIPAPAYARAGNGGNQLAAERRMLRRQSRR